MLLLESFDGLPPSVLLLLAALLMSIAAECVAGGRGDGGAAAMDGAGARLPRWVAMVRFKGNKQRCDIGYRGIRHEIHVLLLSS